MSGCRRQAGLDMADPKLAATTMGWASRIRPTNRTVSVSQFHRTFLVAQADRAVGRHAPADGKRLREAAPDLTMTNGLMS